MQRNKTWFLWSSLIVVAVWVGLSALILAQTPVTVEPNTLRTDLGGTVSIYDTTNSLNFAISDTVRLAGFGILQTTYVNPAALQAVVPAGLAPGAYRLDVVRDSVTAPIGAGALTLVAPPAPTKTPKPAESPPAGQPILTIRNYSVTPSQVRPGREFTITVEVYNNGSRAGENTMATIPGGAFVPVGQNGHMFGQVHINHTFVIIQRMRVPADASNGVQQLQINISANDWAGNHYDFPQNISIEVVGASGGTAPTGKPKILIEGAQTSPAVIAPGTPFTLTLRLANRGSRTAVNVTASADTTAVVPAQGSGVASAENVAINDVVTVTLPLLLQSAQEGGRQGLKVSLEYSDYSGGSYTDQQTVGVNIDTSLANRSQLLIDQYVTAPDFISPGDSFTLTLHLANVGGGNAQRITLALGGEEGDKLGAFVPVGGSNVSFVSGIGAGEMTTVSLRLLVSGNAETRAHSLPIALAYDTAGGTRDKSTQQVSLLVRRRPDFKVSFYRPLEGAAMVGQPFLLPIEVLNAGNARFTVSELEATGDRLEFVEESSVYVGPLDPGGSWTLDTLAVANEPGPVDVIVNVHYVDDLNQTQIVSTTLTVEVMEMPVGPEGPVGPGFPGEGEPLPETFWQKVGRFVKGFLGLGS